MDTAQEVHNAYRNGGGKCGFDAFQELLRAFYEHTLNSHVWGEPSETAQKGGDGLWFHPSRDAAETAWAAETRQCRFNWLVVGVLTIKCHSHPSEALPDPLNDFRSLASQSLLEANEAFRGKRNRIISLSSTRSPFPIARQGR